MRRPLFMLCLAIVLCVIIYLRIRPPADFSYGEAAGEEVCLTGQVYKKEFQKGQSGPVLLLYVKPERLRFSSLMPELSGFQNPTSDAFKLQNQNIPFQDNFICVLQSGTEEPPVGSRVILTGKLNEYEHATNPGQFDAKDYYSAIGISAKLTYCQVIAMDGKEAPILEKLWQFRCLLGDVLDSIFEENAAAFLRGMLLGDKQALDKEVKSVYQTAGILHILAISGLHISLIGMGLFQFLRKLHLPLALAAILCSICMILYGFMAGMPVSAMRAIGMFLLRLLAQCTGRTYDMQTALLLCAGCMLLENSLYLYQAGFLLSFFAILAVCMLKPALLSKQSLVWAEGLREMSPPKRRQVNFVSDSLLTSFSVAVFTLPVQLYFYYEVSLYAVLWNLAVIPLAGICMGMGMLSLGLSFVEPLLASPPALLASAIIALYEKGSAFVGTLPGNIWRPGRPKAWQIVVFFLVVFLVLLLKKLQPRYKIGLLFGAVLLFEIEFQSELKVTFLDVGQGDCVCMELPDGTTWLCDGGSSDAAHAGEYRIEAFLKHEGIEALDAVFLSHADSDHINGIEELLQRGSVPIKLLVLPCTEKPAEKTPEEQENSLSERSAVQMPENKFAGLLLLAKQKEIPVLWLEAGMEWRSGEIEAVCLHPPTGFEEGNLNAASQVIYITYRSFSMLLTGDVEKAGEEAVLDELQKQGIEKATVLKVAHHGSGYSGSKDFLEQINPAVSIISCGKNNRYGHPHPELLERLENVGAQIFKTPESGAVTVYTDGATVRLQQYK